MVNKMFKKEFPSLLSYLYLRAFRERSTGDDVYTPADSHCIGFRWFWSSSPRGVRCPTHIPTVGDASSNTIFSRRPPSAIPDRRSKRLLLLPSRRRRRIHVTWPRPTTGSGRTAWRHRADKAANLEHCWLGDHAWQPSAPTQRYRLRQNFVGVRAMMPTVEYEKNLKLMGDTLSRFQNLVVSFHFCFSVG